MGNQNLIRLWLIGVAFFSLQVWGLSDSLISVQFESEVVKNVSAQISQYQKLGDLLRQIKTANRSDQLYLAKLMAEYGDRSLPKFRPMANFLQLDWDLDDKSEIELISSLERAYIINAIEVRVFDGDSVQENIEHFEHIYKSRKRRTVVRHFWEEFFLSVAQAKMKDEDPDPRIAENAKIWGAVAVAVEQKINQQAMISLHAQAPAVAELLQTLKANVGTHAWLEVSCRPRYVLVNGEERGPSYDQLVSQCCHEKAGNCESVINGMSNTAHPATKVAAPSTPSPNSGNPDGAE